MRPGAIGSWSPGCRVSGSRSAVHSITTLPNSAKAPNTQGHGPTSMMSWPSEGARIGTARNTTNENDMTWAMALPV